MSTRNWMIYGAYGYTGALLAEEAVRRGHRPLLAGRDEGRLKPLADRLGLDYATVSLEDTAALHELVRRSSLVLHAAGPYIHTARPMLAACLAGVTHYLDISGEIDALAWVFEGDQRARELEIALIPGVGFDVVPTDCLAGYVAAQVPDAQRLTLAIQALSTASAGTAKGSLETLAAGPGKVRRAGQLTPYPWGSGLRRFRFQNGEKLTVPIPWGDLVTAYHSTGIPNITTYFAYPPALIRLLRYASPAFALLRIDAVRRAALGWIGAHVRGPDEALRETGRSYIYARAENASGQAAEAWMETAEGYRFTAQAGILAVERTLKEHPYGALTPAQAFGVDFVLEVRGSRRQDSLPQQESQIGAGKQSGRHT